VAKVRLQLQHRIQFGMNLVEAVSDLCRFGMNLSIIGANRKHIALSICDQGNVLLRSFDFQGIRKSQSSKIIYVVYDATDHF